MNYRQRYDEYLALFNAQIAVCCDRFLPVGSRVRILPVHACATAACFDAYHLLREGRIVAELSRCRGW